jgi:predicted TPR repeat methyltransferase
MSAARSVANSGVAARVRGMPKPPRNLAELEIELWLKQAGAQRAAGNLRDAVQLYQRMLARRPSHPDALRELGLAALDTGAFEAAAEILGRAVAAAPRSGAALIGLARTHHAAGRPAEAIALLRNARALSPRDPGLFLLLGDAQLDIGDRDAALRSFRMVMKLAPGHPRAAHMVAALEGSDLAARNAYTGALFDQYAKTFDSHLVAALRYDVPTQLRGLIDAADADRRFDAALDLGCGTGLVAEAMQGKVAAIDGIDLSPMMVDAARAKNLYRAATTIDIDSFLARREVAGAYEFVLAADVFIYVGRLEGVFAGVARALQPGGLFAFSVEHTTREDVEIRSSGRFAQSEAYIARLAAEHGFAVEGRLLLLERP